MVTVYGVYRLWEGRDTHSTRAWEFSYAKAANKGKRRSERRRGSDGLKSGSPCTACTSKTRSSFLHLQVERRDIRHGLHRRTFSSCDIVYYPSLSLSLSLSLSAPLFLSATQSSVVVFALLSASSLTHQLEIRCRNPPRNRSNDTDRS